MKRATLSFVLVAVAFSVAAVALAGKVRVNGDNAWTVFINGDKVAEGADWQVATVSDFAEGGSTVIGIYVHDAEPGASGVGGFLADVVLDDGTYIATDDPRWKCDSGAALADRNDGWEKPGFDDSGWDTLNVMDQFGGGVWGFGADKMRQVLNNPDSTSFWSWCGPNDGADDVYFRIALGSPATAVEPRGKAAVRWAELKSGR